MLNNEYTVYDMQYNYYTNITIKLLSRLFQFSHYSFIFLKMPDLG